MQFESRTAIYKKLNIYSQICIKVDIGKWLLICNLVVLKGKNV